MNLHDAAPRRPIFGNNHAYDMTITRNEGYLLFGSIEGHPVSFHADWWYDIGADLPGIVATGHHRFAGSVLNSYRLTWL